MPATKPSRELRAFCHEHHVEMRHHQSPLNSGGDAGQMGTYSCTVPDCLVHYSIAHGYFISSHNGNGNEPDMVPEVRCPHDGTPMYLAEIDRGKRGFRLWRCPQCDGKHTNEEGLVGLASHETQDVSGRSPAEP